MVSKQNLDDRISGLSPEKQALLAKRLKGKHAESPRLSAIPRRTDQAVCPLSHAQQRMWFLNQWEPESPFYNIISVVRIQGRLDVMALQSSFNEVIRRHEILRAHFITESGHPKQIIDPQLIIELPVIDLSAELAEQRDRRFHELARQEANQPFDLTAGPLLRASLIQLSLEDHVLFLTFHHIVADGWSIGVFIRESAMLYSAYSQSANLEMLPDLPIQYGDYAEWQRSWLQGDVLQEQLHYWKDKLGGADVFLELPLDHPRPTVQTVNGALYKFQLSKALSDALKALAHSEDATLYMTLLAAFEVLLHRLSGQEDIRVGTPVANRRRKELEGLIGLFVNTLVMRGEFGGEPSFREFLRQMRETALGAYAHQDLPLELLLEELNVVRDLSRTPLYQVMFALQDEPLKSFDVPDASLSLIEPESVSAKFDLTLFIEEHQDGLYGAVEYNTDLFEEETIARFMQSYETLLLGIVDNPDDKVWRLPMLREHERRQLLLEWNNTYREFPSQESLAQLFEMQVQERPDAIAIRDSETPTTPGLKISGPNAINQDRKLTYGELNAQANQLAHFLRARGIGPNVLVGIYMERSLMMVVTTLAIIKAGGAYLPLDLSYPPERIAFLLEDSQTPILLTSCQYLKDLEAVRSTSSHSNNSSTILNLETICLDQEPHQGMIATCSVENLPIITTGENLAYVMYTSGSTGTPKGVAIRQRSISRLLFNTNFINIKPLDRIAHASNPSFDAATFEIWGALLFSAELVIVAREIALSAKAYAAYLREKQITNVFMTTALFNLVAHEAPNAFATLETLIFGGEAVDANSVRIVVQNGKPDHLIHAYGPTESTTFSNTYEVTEVSDRAISIPIGWPIANTQSYILDRHMQPVPVGVPGELYLGGDGLAECYLHRPELTAEKFVSSPFFTELSDFLAKKYRIHSPNQGFSERLIYDSRLYKTGDRARFLANGAVDFLGRFDFQVKLRGLRIELGEIENALSQFPAIQDSVVLLREDTPGDKRLVAYLTLKASRNINVSELRTFLKSKIPEFMIPAIFVILEKLPITQNGKIDRVALPVPDQSRPDLDKAFIAPTTAVEKYLVSLWQSVLGIDKIGIYDDFFELGGDSLKAAVFVNRLQEELNVATHVRSLFMAPTVADLSLYMNEYFPQTVEKIQSEFSNEPSAAMPTDQTSQSMLRRVGGSTSLVEHDHGLVDAEKLALIRQIIKPLSPRLIKPVKKNPPAVFVLSPPRSGSTLLRTMLGGNPGLFSPPELDLLSFNTLAERRAAFSGPYTFWLEGVERAIMELKGCDTDQARQMMQDFENNETATQQFYGIFQEWIDAGSSQPRLLVDKTPVYALDLEILKRAEEDFEKPYYLHLIRHPFASIYSFIEAKLDGVFFRYEHPFSQRELAELVWIVSHQNILEFLAEIPQERQLRISFETMVKQSEFEMERICEFLNLPYNPGMLKPYEGDRMTSGVRPGAQMVGDFKFYLRKDIDPKAADRWKKFHGEDTLSPEGWELAEKLGYERLNESTLSPGGNALASRGEYQPSITSMPRDVVLPLSFAQQRLWFLDQWEPGSPYYNIPTAVRLKGRMNVNVMQKTFNEIIRRHEVLRTRYTVVDGRPVLVVDENVDAQVRLINLQDLAEDERDVETRRLASEETRLPFDLAKDLLVRASVIQLGREDSLFILVMHHIVSDGWSAGVIIREIAALYSAFSQGQPSPLPELPIQYVDYANWQRQYLQGEVLEKQMGYWKQKLDRIPALLELPIDHPRPAVQSQQGAQRHFELPGELFAGLKRISQQTESTLYMTLLAAFQVLLARYSGQEDICVGTPVANRNRAEIEGLIGFFVNTLVLRGDLSQNPTFREYLGQVKQTAIEAYDHQDIPFERLVDELQPERNQSHTPLFQVMFTLQESPIQSLKLPGLTVTPVQMDSGTSKFDLIMTMVDRGDVLKGVLEYNTDLFEPATIDRMVGHYQTLLQTIVANPDQPVSGLHLLTDNERQRLLVDWNRTFDLDTAPYLEQTLDRLFEEQVNRTPEALAVMIGDKQLTYRELDERAEALAVYLRKREVGADRIVGLLVERSLEAIVGIIGVLKAGGAYLPLDPEYPADRLAYILEDTKAPILLSQRRLVDRMQVEFEKTSAASLAAEIICLDEREWVETKLTDSEPRKVDHTARNLAYIIYTSGSTGRPKGVMIEHRSAINLWLGLNRSIYANHADAGAMRVSLNAPLPFDASVQEWLMLLSGHALVIIPAEVRQDAERLLGYIREKRIDVLDCVPSQLKMLIGAGLLDGAGWTPRAVLPGGEAIDNRTWEQMASVEGVEFYNMYGPTECTVDSTICRVSCYPGHVSIGRPVVNAQVYVLDRNLQPAPIGVAGELYLGGVGVGRGYLNRAELTAERFIANPFVEYQREGELSIDAGDRLYKTGDRVRYLVDGYLEYIGRIDFQVKLRGFRIELGEIENVLMETAGIKEAAVVVREDEPGNKQLVAYIVTDSAERDVSALRARLKAKLPEYMVPGVYVYMESLPMTPNRKVDRKALPKPEGLRPDMEAAYEQPRTDQEAKLVKIWQQVLKVDRVGVRDNFFDLGGDSILSIQVVARANQEGMRIKPRQIFEAQTIEALAAIVGEAEGEASEAEQGLVTGEVVLTPIQRMFFETRPENASHMNQAIMLEVKDDVDQHALQAAVEGLVRQHDGLRLRYEPAGDEWHQVIVGMEAAERLYTLERIDLSGLGDVEQGRAIEARANEIQRSLDIQIGPILRVAHFELGKGKPGRMLLVIHHLAVDGISWRILVEDLLRGYEQTRLGEALDLGSKTSSLRQWSEQLVEYARSEEVENELSYWMESGNAARSLGWDELPIDLDVAGENLAGTVASVRGLLGEAETGALVREVPAAYNTEIGDVLLTALVRTVASWRGQSGQFGVGGVQVALEGHGREEIGEVDVTRTVGWFTSVYPVNLELDRAWVGPGEALMAVKEQLRRVPQKGIGYGLLRYLNPKGKALGELPLGQMSFNYLGQVDAVTPAGAAFKLAGESVGVVHDPRGKRRHLIDVIVSVTENQLRLEWLYSEKAHRRETIENLVKRYIEELGILIQHCTTTAGGYTPSDFPEAELSQAEIDDLMDELSED